MSKSVPPRPQFLKHSFFSSSPRKEIFFLPADFNSSFLILDSASLVKCKLILFIPVAYSYSKGLKVKLPMYEWNYCSGDRPWLHQLSY